MTCFGSVIGLAECPPALRLNVLLTFKIFIDIITLYLNNPSAVTAKGGRFIMNILVSLDSNYIYPLCTMLRSLSKNCSGSHIDLYVAYSSLTENDFSQMETALCNVEHKIRRVPVSDELFADFPVLDRISKATYYRLLAGDILPSEVDRILYLDPDIVINKNLEEFYSSDMKGCMIAGATHLFGILGAINRLRLGMKHKHSYINAGVLLIDLKKWRETTNANDILTYISKKHRTLFLADQDVVNALFWDKTLAVDERIYNLDEKTLAYYSKKTAGDKRIDLQWVRDNAVIIHFNGKHKPWKEKPYGGKLGDYFESYKNA